MSLTSILNSNSTFVNEYDKKFYTDYVKIVLPYFDVDQFLNRYPQVRKAVRLDRKNFDEYKKKIIKKLSASSKVNFDGKIDISPVSKWDTHIYNTIREYTSGYNYSMMSDILNILEEPTASGEGQWGDTEIKIIIQKIEFNNVNDTPYQRYDMYGSPEYREFIMDVIEKWVLAGHGAKYIYTGLDISRALGKYNYPFFIRFHKWSVVAVRCMVKEIRKNNIQ